jgi:hypothetical protein
MIVCPDISPQLNETLCGCRCGCGCHDASHEHEDRVPDSEASAVDLEDYAPAFTESRDEKKQTLRAAERTGAVPRVLQRDSSQNACASVVIGALFLAAFVAMIPAYNYDPNSLELNINQSSAMWKMFCQVSNRVARD